MSTFNPFTDTKTVVKQPDGGAPVTVIKTKKPTGPFGKGDQPVQMSLLPADQKQKEQEAKETVVRRTTITKHIQVIFGNIPAKSNCYRIVTFTSKDKKTSYSHLAKTKDLAKYEKDFILQCMKYRNLELDVPFVLEVDVYYKRSASDLDNAFKVLLDCLQQVGCQAIKNDNKCMRIIANKYIDADNPRIEFTIKPI